MAQQRFSGSRDRITERECETMKKGIMLFTIVFSTLLLAAGLFVFTTDYEKNARAFPNATIINGVDCSGMSGEQAIAALTDARNNAVISVQEDGVEIGQITGLGITYDIEPQVNKLLHGNILRLPMPKFMPGNLGVSKNVDMNVAEVTDETKEYLRSMDFLYRESENPTKDAYVDMTAEGFPIVPEFYGDNIDPGRFVDKAVETAAAGEPVLTFVASDYYKLPDITKESPELLDYQNYCQTNLSQKITLTIFDGDVTIPVETLAEMKIRNEDGSVSIDEDLVYTYAYNLTNNHSTIGTTRTFKAANGKDIQVGGGNYGFVIDENAEAEQLIEDLKSNKDVTRQPCYSMVPYGAGAGVNGDIGNSYVEVDLTAQKVYLFVNGSKILETPVVTGNTSKKHGTPTGVYRIAYKDREATLKGLEDDGKTEYESKVDYWMPFIGDVGLHDAPWRTAFGGDIYKTGGSHGCVNMPPAAAATLFNNVSAGFPVIVHE